MKISVCMATYNGADEFGKGFLDTASLAYLHFSGMLLTPIAGRLIYGDASQNANASDKLRNFHQVSGYITTTLFAGAVIVMKF